ncbi:hypothetical protein FB566_3547 [Stackebrandtia endophytica]|uniref:Uncharacterized protein n=1 Tax=Stackebrandtia endophytica TaxID=1496996 RepID=A0A543AZG4_9ACTN|nr:hypothetical protein [Stackebrandtia endophytica]TQL77972.1 hypothetical protein FB566_3547 [Stackebrandtia endophytica]
MADVTGGDLYKLWTVANVHLPNVAAVYTSGSSEMGGNQGDIRGAFETGGEGPHGQTIYGGPCEAFYSLHSEFQHVLAQTGQNLLDTASAVNKAIENFSEEDTAAGNDLDSILEGDPYDGTQLHDPNDPSQNPPAEPPGEPDFPDDYDSPGDEEAEDPTQTEQDIEDIIDDMPEPPEEEEPEEDGEG